MITYDCAELDLPDQPRPCRADICFGAGVDQGGGHWRGGRRYGGRTAVTEPQPSRCPSRLLGCPALRPPPGTGCLMPSATLTPSPVTACPRPYDPDRPAHQAHLRHYAYDLSFH